MNVLILGGEHPLAPPLVKHLLDLGERVHVLIPTGLDLPAYEPFRKNPRLVFDEGTFYRTPYFPSRSCYEEVYSFVAAVPLTTFKVADIVNAAQAHIDLVDLCGVDSLFVLTSKTNDEMFRQVDLLTSTMLMEHRLMHYSEVGQGLADTTPQFLRSACRGFPKPEGENDADE